MSSPGIFFFVIDKEAISVLNEVVTQLSDTILLILLSSDSSANLENILSKENFLDSGIILGCLGFILIDLMFFHGFCDLKPGIFQPGALE